MRTPQHAKTRQTAVAGFIPRPLKAMTPNPSPRQQNQQGNLSRPRGARKTETLLRLYGDHMLVRYALKTAKGYLALLRQHLGWLGERGIALVETRTEDLLAYQTSLFALRKKDGSVYSTAHLMRHVSVLKSFYGFLHRRAYALTNAAAALEYPRVEQRLPRLVLSQREARKIVEAPDTSTPLGLRDRAVLETLYATGIRAGELASLKLEDVDTEERLVRVVLGKGRKDRNVPLTRSAAEAVEAYLLDGRPRIRGARTSPLLFMALRGGRMHHDTLNSLVQHWTKKAGVARHVTCHTFRHSAATHLLKGGADIRHIQALLGHASLAATERYTRVEVSDLKEIIRRAHPRGR